MSSIIQTISVEEAEKKHLREKLAEHIGIQKLFIILDGGDRLEGIVSEVGKDYICVIEGETDLIIPISNIRFFRYSH